MDTQLLHVFRNTPFGRETLLQSLYFCKKTDTSLVVYIPEFTKFLMYFDNDVVQVDLDGSYLAASDTAKKHAEALANDLDMQPVFISPTNYTASTLPDIPVNFDFMCCPRSMSDLSSKIGLGHIGSKVRTIVRSAKFPVLITSPVFKPWQSVAVFFGGSKNAVNAIRLGIRLARTTGMPLLMFTQLEGKKTKESYQSIIDQEGLTKDVEKYVSKWTVFDNGAFEDNLYNIPHDSLVVSGAYGHSVIKDILFGSKMEIIQSTIMNNIMVVGPNYTAKS